MGLFSGNVIETSSTGISEPPPWLQSIMQGMVERSDVLSQEQYPQFPGPRIEGFSEDQLGAFDLARGGIGLGGQELGMAQSTLAGALNAPDSGGIGQYMNPFTDLVTQRSIFELGRQNDIQAQAEQGAAAQAGAFGGGRHGVVEAERERNFDRLIGDVISKQNQSNYQQALEQFNRQQAIGLQAAPQYADLGAAAKQFQAQDVATLSNVGAAQQGIGQQSLDVAYQDFWRQQQYPYEQLGFLGGQISGAPTGSSTQTVATQPTASTGTQLAGLGIAGLGALGQTSGGIGGFIQGIGDFIGDLF